MIFSLTEDQQMVRDMVRKFAAESVRQRSASWNDAGDLPGEVFHELHDLGLMAATLTADDGGSELDAVSFALVLEELARQDASLAVVVASHDVALAAAPERAEMFERGEVTSVVVGNLVTSPTRLDRVLGNGTIHPIGAVRPVEGLGLSAAGLAECDLHSTPPAAWRANMAAVAVGVARGALEEATSYAQEREQFGKPIAAYQAIQFKLAEMAAAVDGARLLALHAAEDHAFAAAALRFAANAAVFVTDEAVQIHGGYGYVREYPVERYYRDARWFPLWVDA